MEERGTLSKDLLALQGVKELMFGRRLSPGQKIIYRDLEEMLGMSKTPIINALVRLEHEGLVISKKNRGFFVRELSATEVHQMYDLREKMEAINRLCNQPLPGRRFGWFKESFGRLCIVFRRAL